MSMRHNAVTYPARFEPLPAGYQVIHLNSGGYQWVNDELGQSGPVHWDKFWVRKCAFAHAERMAREKQQGGISG